VSGPVLIIDDHAIVATSLVLALREQGLDARRCPVGSAREVLDEARRHPAGLALVDLDLGDQLEGAALVAPLRAAGWRVLVLTGTTDRSKITAAVEGGALGWVSKAAPFPELVDAVVAATGGGAALPGARLLDRLSVRERAVLDRLAAGQRAARIAEEFVVSLATVRSQIRSILTKLEVGSQLEAVALARSHR
jgi:DNA-binding NarL/FixJ family response regulator